MWVILLKLLSFDSHIGLEFTELLVVGVGSWLQLVLYIVSDLVSVSLLEVLECVLLCDGNVAFFTGILVGLLREQIDIVRHLITVQLV